MASQLVCTPQKSRDGSPPATPGSSPRGKFKEDLQSGGFLIRIPAVKPTGNQLEDQEVESAYSLLANMCVRLIAEPKHIGPINMALNKRLAIQDSQVQVEANARFSETPTLSNLHHIDGPWLIMYLVKVSDMTTGDCTSLRESNPDLLTILLQYDQQLNFGVRYPQGCQVKDVFLRVLLAFSLSAGSRLKKFKEGGGIEPGCTGLCMCPTGCYVPVFGEDGFLMSVKHEWTGVELEPEEMVRKTITKEWRTIKNFNDGQAAMQLAPLPPIQIMSFFKKKEGFKHKMPAQRSKDMNDVFVKAQSEYEAALEETKRGQFGGDAIDTVSKTIAEQNITKKRAAMEVTKEKALARMHEKRAKNNVEVTQDKSDPKMRQPDFGSSPGSKDVENPTTPQTLHLTLRGSKSSGSKEAWAEGEGPQKDD